MYSYEIDNILKNNNHAIDSEVYINIIQTSPQINHVKYSPYSDNYEMWSDIGEYWNFKVYNKERQKNL